jgi:enoyl-CoA hydratase/carnithine racemase
MTDNDAILHAVDDGVATISFNRPDKLNALTPGMLQQFFSKVDLAASDPGVRVILITGVGRGFSAGLDLSVIGSGGSEDPGPDSGATVGPAQWDDSVGPALGTNFGSGWNKLVMSRKPTIAAINGPAFGWGFILAMHCDIRFAAKSAIMNATFARLGVPAEKGIGWLLTRAIGTARAADLLYSARRFDGVEAERLGLVNAVLDDGEVLAHAKAYAANIAANAAPRALAAMKAQIWTAADTTYAEAFAAADLEQDRCTKTEDFREGFMSYREKRPPKFQGR